MAAVGDYRETRGRRFADKGFCLLAGALLLLPGCYRDHRETLLEKQLKTEYKPLQNFTMDVNPQRDVTGRVMDYIKPGPTPVISVNDAAPASHRADGRGDDADYIDKADVYWKLNWIRRQLLTGQIPTNLVEAIAKTKKELKTTDRDKNYEVAARAVAHLEQGVEHLRANKTLKDANINSFAVPWRLGEDGVQRFIDNNGLGFGGSPLGSGHANQSSNLIDEDDAPQNTKASTAPPPPLLTDIQQKAIDVILKYAKEYGQSPEQLMRDEWREAIQEINTLRDNLGLMHREANNDGDSAAVSSGIGDTVSGQIDAVFPDTFLSSHGNAPGKDADDPVVSTPAVPTVK